MSKWKMVPTVATAEMLAASADVTGATRGIQDRRCHAAMVAAAPPFVVSDASIDAALNAFSARCGHDAVEAMRDAIEAALAEAAKGDV